MNLFIVIIILVLVIAIIIIVIIIVIELSTGDKDYLSYYTLKNGYDYGGNNIGDCGRYLTDEDIAKACYDDSQCKGFSIRDGKPWCLKNTLQNGGVDDSHNFYVKN